MVSLICIIIIAVVFYYFNNVLGTRTGSERPPFDPYKEAKNAQKTLAKHEEENDNLDNLDSDLPLSWEEHVKAIEEACGSKETLVERLKSIAQKDKNFNIITFQQGARLAYEMILTAFSKGDKEVLESLLDEDLYQDFAKAIDERSARGEDIQFTFVGVNKVDIVDAKLEGMFAQITVHFKSEVISATYDADKKLIEGDPKSLTFIEDYWSFGRILDSNDPNWKLIATAGDDEIEKV